MSAAPDRRLLGFSQDLRRPDDGEASTRVTFVELFFDLVFVFAVTQVAHGLIDHPDPQTLLQTVILCSAVWWVWVNTAWVTNWLNPERGSVRTMLFVLMLLGMLMSSAIPHAFDESAVLFVVAYVGMQVGRSVYAALALRRHWHANFLNFVRISVWSGAAGVLWIAGAVGPDEARFAFWLAAVVVEFAGPVSAYYTPVLGATSVKTWTVSGEHMSERAGLFLIIALGESIIVTGSAFSAQGFTALNAAAFLSAFASTLLMWFLYFSHGASGGRRYIIGVSDTGRVARLAYTYVHVLLVFGIVLTAVADELVLLHPLGHDDSVTAVMTAGLICGAAGVYLVGNLLFKRAVGGPWLFSHLAGVGALVVLFAAHPLMAPLTLNWLSNAVLLVVVIADEVAYRRARREREHAAARDAAAGGS